MTLFCALSNDLDNVNESLHNQILNFKMSYLASDVVGLWEQGAYNLSYGNKINTSSYNSRIRTTEYISKTIKYIEADSDAQFALLIYDSGTYLGMWSGASIQSTSVWISNANLNDIGNYDFNITIRNKNDTAASIAPTYAQHLTFASDTGKAVSRLTEDVSGCFDGEAMVGSTPIIDDFNNAIINRYYSINTTGIENQPEESKGHLLYFGLEGGKTDVKSGRELQFFITHNNDFFFRGNRFSSGAPWNTWAKLAKDTDVPYIPRPSLALFQSIGIIGDSFASGEIYDANAGAHANYYALSWGQILARMCGCTAVNYSKGGLTTKSWLTDTSYGLTKLNAENANNLYIIALGINDANHSDTIPVGTIADIESNSATNFYSYYGQIIRAIKTHAPNAIIMLSTLARFSSIYNPYSDAIKAIGAYYDLPVLDLSESAFFQSDFFANNQISNHPTAVNYSAMAKEYKWLIEKALEDNAADFATYIV